MTKIYAAPSHLTAPSLALGKPFDEYHKETEAYVAAIQQWAKENGTSDCAGEIIRFSVADGYATYVVFSLRPVSLIHVDSYDGYQFPYANRLTASDIRERVKHERTLRELFAKA